jgi:hypothetical protein
MRSLRRDGFVGEVSNGCYFRADRSIAELFGFGADDLAAGRAYFLRCGGELRLPARQVRRCANMLFTGCTRLTQSLKDALEIYFAFVQRWLIDHSKTASTFTDISSEALFSIAIRRQILRQTRYFAFQSRLGLFDLGRAGHHRGAVPFDYGPLLQQGRRVA